MEETFQLEVADVVLVLRDKQCLEAISNEERILGQTIRFASGPLPKDDTGAGGFSSEEPDASVWIYAKSKGHTIDLDFTGVRIRQARDANVRDYGVNGISVKKMLSGQVKGPSFGAATLRTTTKALDTQSGDCSGFPASASCPGNKRPRKLTSTNGPS